MIYYHAHLMPGDSDATLFLVSNPVEVESFEDHEACLYLRLLELIEEAQAQGENVAQLLENYLQLACPLDEGPADFTQFLWGTGPMQLALAELKDRWESLDPSRPEEGLLYGRPAQDNPTQHYPAIDLRRYLETLASEFHG